MSNFVCFFIFIGPNKNKKPPPKKETKIVSDVASAATIVIVDRS